MAITIRFSGIPEDLIFEVGSRTEYANAVYEAWKYARVGVQAMTCLVECPENLPQEWATVPDMAVPPYWGNLVELYRQWPQVVECVKRLEDLSAIVEESRFIEGIIDLPEDGLPIRQGVVVPFIRAIK